MKKASFFDSLAMHLKPRLLAIFTMGFSSGLPLALILSVLSARLTDAGVSRGTIGLFGLVFLPYTYKFIWSFLLDYIPMPFLNKFFGMRRAWLFVMQIGLFTSIYLLGTINPAEDLKLVAIIAIALAFFSASQDIIIDAYRIEILNEEEQAYGVSMTTYGYRVAMFVSGAGSLYLSGKISWELIHLIMGGLIFTGFLASLYLGEPKNSKAKLERYNTTSISEVFVKMIVNPAYDMLKRNKIVFILLFVLFHKLPDAMFGVMATNYYKSMSFSNEQIAVVAKTYGLFMTLGGVFVGSILVRRYGMYNALFWSLIAQMSSNLIFIWQNHNPGDLSIFTAVISIENFSGGLITLAMMTYMTYLCNLSFTGAQYAILSSIASQARLIVSAPAGYLVDALNWDWFFVATFISGIPALYLLSKLPKESLPKVK